MQANSSKTYGLHTIYGKKTIIIVCLVLIILMLKLISTTWWSLHNFGFTKWLCSLPRKTL